GSRQQATPASPSAAKIDDTAWRRLSHRRQSVRAWAGSDAVGEWIADNAVGQDDVRDERVGGDGGDGHGIRVTGELREDIDRHAERQGDADRQGNVDTGYGRCFELQVDGCIRIGRVGAIDELDHVV